MYSASTAILTLRSLVLNSSYEPMRVVSWQKALVLWFQGKVDVLEYHSVFARSACSSFQLPSVLRLRSYVRPRPHGAIRFCRENVYIRDGFTCQYCRVKYSSKLLTLDHVVPASHQGPRNWTNVVTACRECNQRKANRTPTQARMPLFREPRMPTWLPLAETEFRLGPFPSNWRHYLRYKTG
ncbi:MAG: HNH endonuclease [Bdellovibrionales bacterium]|jgi:5-methylcytosine-specific restriction endonuclease McrA|nr:HNH endonuclease [Bdellovibrionales bacterium]